MILKTLFIATLGVTILNILYKFVDNLFSKSECASSILKDKFEIYNELYLNCVSSPLGKTPPPDKVKIKLQFLCLLLEENPYLHNLLSSSLLHWLILYQKSQYSDQYITDICYRISIDFARVQYKLNISNPVLQRNIVITECLFTACMSFAAFYEKEYLIMVLMILFFLGIVMTNLSEIKVLIYNTKNRVLFGQKTNKSNRNRNNNKSF